MRTAAMKTIATAGTAMLLLTACGSSTGAEPDGETPSPTQSSATATPTAAAAPRLERGQTSQELAFDFVDALNAWFHSGRDEFKVRLPESADPQTIAELAVEIAEKHRGEFADALLAEDFEQPNFYGETMTEDRLVEIHAQTLAKMAEGHQPFTIDDNGQPVIDYSLIHNNAYKVTYVAAKPIYGQIKGGIAIPVNQIPDPGKHGLEPEIAPIQLDFVEDGDNMRVAWMSWDYTQEQSFGPE